MKKNALFFINISIIIFTITCKNYIIITEINIYQAYQRNHLNMIVTIKVEWGEKSMFLWMKQRKI